MISFKSKGDFKKAHGFLERLLEVGHSGKLDRYGQMGVEALSNATPKDTGLAASSWRYVINQSHDRVSIQWLNDDVENGVNVAILLQYGHATRNGGFVQGIDYINPALKPIFDQIANEMWEEVTKR